MVKVHYPSALMTPAEVAARLLAPDGVIGVQDTVCALPPRQDMAVSAQYGIGWDGQRNLYLYAAEYGADQNAPCYGAVAIPKVNDTFEPIAVVVDVMESGWRDWRREVWVLKYDADAGAYVVDKRLVAPAIITFYDSDGRPVLRVPLGVPVAVIAALIIGALAVPVAWKVFSWLESRERRETVSALARLCESDPAACHYAVASIAAANAEAETGGWLSQLKNYVMGGMAALAGVLVLFFKLQVLLEFLRSLLRRR